MKHIIRNAELKDIPVIMELFHFLSPDYHPDAKALENALKHPSTTVLILEDNGQVVGTATLSTRAVPSNGLVGYIDDMVVDPAHRGKGYGNALCAECEVRAQRLGCIRIDLTSHPSRVAANSLYQKRGYQLRETNVFVLSLPSERGAF